MANKRIRKAMITAGVKQWQVAKELGIHEVTFSRMLREELNPDEREKVLQAIDQIKAGK